MIELVLRIGFSLLVVLGLMWGLAKLARRPLSGRGSGNLSVLGRQQLGRNSSVAIVQVVDRAYVLGVTDTQVSLLAETEIEAFQRHPHPPTGRRAAVAVDPETAAVPDDLVGASPVTPDGGHLDGSVLSPRTWRSAVDFLRERTARR